MSEQFSDKRVVVLDTETTGLDVKDGHRIIEVGCVEMKNRKLTGNNLHLYLQPDRAIDAGALAVHGISNEFLMDKPRFEEVADQLRDYLVGAELVIHNAPFDIGFLESEFERCGKPVNLHEVCDVIDSLPMARKQFPGQKANLDALCKRLGVNNSHRTLHGALLDSEILADVYLAMTGGQTALLLDQDDDSPSEKENQGQNVDFQKLKVIRVSEEEQQAHEHYLENLLRKSDAGCVWDQLPRP